jgi:hypothetical protein
MWSRKNIKIFLRLNLLSEEFFIFFNYSPLIQIS